jgi:hypothetical protein
MLGWHVDGAFDTLDNRWESSLPIHGRNPVDRLHQRRWSPIPKTTLHRGFLRHDHLPGPRFHIRPLAQTSRTIGRLEQDRMGRGHRIACLCSHWDSRTYPLVHLRHPSSSDAAQYLPASLHRRLCHLRDINLLGVPTSWNPYVLPPIPEKIQLTTSRLPPTPHSPNLLLDQARFHPARSRPRSSLRRLQLERTVQRSRNSGVGHRLHLHLLRLLVLR